MEIMSFFIPAENLRFRNSPAGGKPKFTSIPVKPSSMRNLPLLSFSAYWTINGYGSLFNFLCTWGKSGKPAIALWGRTT